jgi:DNA-directed RNA polymerase subunit RPC12/RpoP
LYIAGSGYKSIYIPDKDKTCRKEKFYNPVKQNAGHIKALKKLLEVNIPMWSIIVFSDRCTLKNIELTSNDVVVINRYNIEKEIALIHSRNSIDALTENEIVELYKKLYPYTQVSKTVKEQHVRHIREYKDETQHCFQNVKAFEMKTQKNDTLKCPQCNGRLILKTATKGINKGNQFYGCSNYPKCGYIENLTKNSNPKKIKNEIDEFFG